MISYRKKSDVYFFTATNLNWLKLLDNNDHKNIILNSLLFLVENKRVVILAFVIMPNHIHLIWKIENGHKKEEIQRDFLKFTAQQIKFNLVKIDSNFLDDILVNAKDRRYQIWERNPLWFELDNTNTLLQKLNYIHKNPLHKKWFLSELAEDYPFSSANFYMTGKDDFGFLTHYETIM
ncbi:MAG: transposase [Bacteroidetes bacterium]|nr:transposase [Bacteroidota bacterium]